MRSIGSFRRLVFRELATTNTTEIGTAMLPLRRVTLPAPTNVSPRAQRPAPSATSHFTRRPRTESRPAPRRPRRVALALAVLAVLATVAPEQAVAQSDTTFISNTGQTTNFASASVQAVAFTTGTGTYTLSSVGIFVGIQSGTVTPRVQIYGDASGNPGSTLVATMANPGTITESAVNSYTAPANTTLSASTTYWVVTSNSAATDGQGFRVGLTNTTLDSGTAPGWSLGGARSKDDIAATSWTTHTFPLRFQIRGTGGTSTNTPATGAPTITGTPQVGQTLTAATTAIMDAEGLTTPGYTYQWIRVDGGTETNISMATASTYTLVTDDLGTTIKVKVSFTDDASNAETLTSAAFPSSGTVLADPLAHCNAGNTNELWCASLTVGTFSTYTGYASGSDAYGSLAPDTFTYRTATIGVTVLEYDADALFFSVGRSVGTTPADGLLGAGAYTLEIGTGGDKKSFLQSNPGTSRNLVFADHGLSWSTGDKVPVKLVLAPNTAPTSADNTVTATEDTDYRFSATDFPFMDTDTGAEFDLLTIVTLPASGTLTLGGLPLTLPQDVGPAALDDAANTNDLVYSPPANENGDDLTSFTFSVYDGAVDSDTHTMTIDVTAVNDAATGQPAITGTAQVGQLLTAAVGTIADPDGLPNPFLTDTNTSFQWVRVTSGTDDDISGKTASTYTLVTADEGKTIKVKVSFQDGGGGSEGPLTSVATAVVSAAAANTPATGAPTITGTPQVGQTLTAATTTIMDGDGLNNVSYTYQWIRVDGGNETDIGSATASTYTLVGDDQGKTIKVKVSFTDDANNSETLTSVATAVVSAASNTAATGAPTITGTPQVGQRLTAATTTIMDGDGLNNVSYTYQWIRVDGGNETDIGSATASTYTLVGDDQGKTIKVKVSFTDDANNSETLTSVATAVVSAAATVPGAPRSLSATASGTNRINLNWTAPASNGGSPITGYRIEVSLDGGSNWTDRVANTTGTNTSYAHTGLAAGDTRHYRVSAINDNGTGNPSNIDGATTGTTTTTVPGAPTRLTATAGGTTTINLVWNAPASDGGSAITGYRIEVSPDGTSNWTDRVANTNSTTTTYAHTGLAPGTTRHYRVSAINANGTAASSNTANATTDSGDYPKTPPGAPEPLTATAGDGEVFLEWTAPADDGGSRVTGYEYRYAAGDGVPRNTPWRSAGRVLEWTVGALTNGQQYAFEVRARNDVGPGAPAHAVATPLGVPGAPEPLTATAGDGEVFLEWTAAADDGGSPVTGYEYRYAAGDGVPEDTPWQSAGLSLERTVAALTRGRQYAFEVRALNDAGPGAPAKAVATPLGVPSAPERLTATPGDGEVLLEWTAPADDGGSPVTGYEYRYAAGAVPEGRRWRWAGKALERTVNGLTNGLLYAFEVRARNRVGEGRARAVLATPVGVPGAPATLTATAGDGEVGLAWSVPADNGGTPVTGYEYRYTAGAAVPEGTPWQSAGLIHQLTVTGLTNGLQYAFEVRALNRVGGGEARGALATPVGRPGAPASLKATAGDKAVALLWSAPVDDGGTPVTGYEYRYAAGAAVPEGTPWQSAGQTLLRTVTGLSNGQPYAFEVRALNRVGGGEARGALATPVGPPGAPASLAAAAGDGEVGLAWSAPADDGGMPVTGYEYRHAAGDAVPGEIPWREANADRTATVTGLDNETRYAFEVRARNRMGPGETSRTTALPLRLRAELFSSAAAEGEALVVGVRRSGGLAFEAHATIGVTDNALPGVTATEEGRGDGLGRHRLEFAAGEAEATVTVTVAFDGERRQDRALTVTLDSAAARVDGMARAYEPVAPTLVVPVTEGDAGLSVADARVQGKSAMLAFTVSMDRTRDVAVRVNYATEDGSARAGEDYTPVAGTLTIQPGGREGTVEVPVLEALHVTGERTLTLKLSNAGNAVIDDGMATGTIARTSELPKAWLARFGRTASDHAAQAIGRRVLAGERETHVTVAGRRMDGLVGRLRSGGGGLLASTARNMAGRATSGLAATAARSADPDGPGAGPGESAETLRSAVLPDFGFRLPEVQDALLGSSFYVQSGAQQAEGGGGAWAAWGDVATTHFEGAAGDLGLNGDVTTGTVGLDRQWRKLLVGLAFARSGGEGAYGEGAGTITSTLTSVHPYLRYRLAERAQLWGTMGWGRGGLSLTPGRGAGIETDLSNAMAALGGRAVLRRAGATGSSLEIALRSDLLWTSTSSDRAGVLAEATGRASRGRLMLEGAGRVSGLGGVLRHSVEGGLRYDGGDAETGAGLEVGGGLDWARGGLVLRVNGRMLLAYADESYEEWGYGGSLIYEPGDDGRGLRMRLGSSTGAMASGVRSLWALENASGLVRGGDLPFEQRFDAEVGFGLGASALWYPYLATDASGQRRFGLRLNSDRSLDVGVEFGRMNDGTQPSRDALLLRGDIRF